jgi:hypothetical protein
MHRYHRRRQKGCDFLTNFDLKNIRKKNTRSKCNAILPRNKNVERAGFS